MSDTSATTDSVNLKASEFLLKLKQENPEGLSNMRKTMSVSRGRAFTSFLDVFGLGQFIQDENQAYVAVLRSSGNTDIDWTMSRGFISPGGGGIWIYDAKGPNGELKAQDLKWLTKVLEPIEHFRVYALIKFLNYEE